MALVIYNAFSSTTAPANQFLDHVAAGRMQEAYNATDPATQACFTVQKFAEKMEKMGLTKAKGASWNGVNINNESAKLDGYINIASGKCRIKMAMIRSQDTWKIESVLLGVVESQTQQQTAAK